MRYAVAFLITLTVTAAVSLAQPAKPSRKVALLVGVNEYAHNDLGSLKFAEPDVAALAVELERGGFVVTTLRGRAGINPSTAGRAAYFAALSELLRGVTKADTVLLAFSGHGVQLEVGGKESPYFCPADADPSDPKTLVPLNDVLAALRKGGGGHNLILIDACRNLYDRNRAFDGNSVENLPGGTAVFFSCSSGQKARETDKMFPAGDGTKGHGVFFHFVLEALRGARTATDDEGRVTWDRLVPFVKEKVKKANAEWFPNAPDGHRQIPFAIGSLGDVPAIIPAAGPKAGAERDVEFAPGAKMRFCWVPAGAASLTRPERAGDEFRTRGFWLGKYEVTQAEWEAVGANPSYFAPSGTGSGAVKGINTGRLPVENVSWVDCEKFVTAARPRAGTFALPTADQWEYACRGGVAVRLPFHWGKALNGTEANCDGTRPFGTAVKGRSLGRTAVVGSYATSPPHPWGLCDLHGNVAEWCRRDSGTPCARGGAYDDDAEDCAVGAVRVPPGRDFRTPAIGLRVVFTASGQ